MRSTTIHRGGCMEGDIGRPDATTHPASHSQASPIFRLPLEMLGYIFLARIIDEFNGYVDIISGKAPPSPSGPIQAHLVLSSVCRHWRSVALQTPALWAYIQGQSTDAFTAFAAKSKQMPLHIAIIHCDSIDRETRWMRPELDSFLLEIQPSLSRIRELWLRGGWQRRGRGILAGDAPILEKLVVNATDSALVNDRYLHRKQYRLVSQARLTLLAPSLRHLELHNFPFFWQALGTYPLLTKLAIVRSVSREVVGPMEQFFAVLRETPALKDLTLQHALPNFPVEGLLKVAPTPTEMPTLPALERLHLHDLIVPSALFRQYVRFATHIPMSTSLSGPHGSHDLAEIMRVLASDLAQPASPASRSLLLTLYGGYVQLALYPETLPAPPSASYNPRLVLDPPARSLIKVPAWRTTVRELFEPLRPSLGSVQNIFLRVSGTASSVADTLGLVLHVSDQSSASLFPGLERMWLDCIQFSHWRSRPGFDALLDLLGRRHRSGKPLRRLSVLRCPDIDQADFELLRAVVEDIEWDRYEGPAIVPLVPSSPAADSEYEGEEDDYMDMDPGEGRVWSSLG